MAQRSEWFVGAASDCDIVIDESVVSSRHCRLLFRNGHFELEDAGSTNGTYVNGVRLQSRQIVTQQDRITLGTSVPFPWNHAGVQAAVNAQSASARTMPPPRNQFNQSVGQEIIGRESSWNLLLFIGAGALVALLALGGGIALTLRDSGRDDDSGRDEDAALLASPTRDLEAPPKSDVPSIAGGLSSTSPVEGSNQVESSRTVASAKQLTTSVPADPANAMYCVVVADEEESQQYRLGTAVAIDGNRLITSASVLAAADQLADQFPVMTVVSADLQSLRVQSRKSHPRFAKAFAEVAPIKQRLDMLQATGTPSEKGPQQAITSEQEKKLATELDGLQRRGQDLANVLLANDIALIQVQGPIPQWVAVASHPPEANANLTLMGLPARTDAIFFSPKRPLTVQRANVRQSLEPLPLKRENCLFARCDAEQINLNWTGSPILNERNEVVAVYCRSTPAESATATPARDRFEAPLVGLLRDL